MYRLITERLESALCYKQLQFQTENTPQGGSIKYYLYSFPIIHFIMKTFHEAHKKGVLIGFIMMSLVLQLLTTTRKYCAVQYFSTRHSDRESCPLIRRSRGGRILPLTTGDRMERTWQEDIMTVRLLTTFIH